MGDPRATPAFGSVDLDLGEDLSAFGVEPEPQPAAEAAPPSTSRVFNRSMSVHDESTRIVMPGDPLSPSAPPTSPLDNDGNTRAWADVDEALLLVGKQDDAHPSSRSASAVSSSMSSRSDRVAAMRELYARGDADGALAMAATLEQPASDEAYSSDDGPDASIVVEFEELSVDQDDPFGGLLPVDEVETHATTMPTAPPPSGAATLTLTERQSIPRLRKSMGEISKLKIDHRAGFLLAHVDGMQTLEEILDICAMPLHEALELITNLKELGVIEFE